MGNTIFEQNVKPSTLSNFTLDYDDAQNVQVDKQLLSDANSVSNKNKYRILPSSGGNKLILTTADDGSSPKDIMTLLQNKNYNVSFNNNTLTIIKKTETGNTNGVLQSDGTAQSSREQAYQFFHDIAGKSIESATNPKTLKEEITRIKSLLK